MPAAWFAYDDIAELYAAVAEPAYFSRAAEDLIAFLEPPAGTRLLDAGTGSGAIAKAAMRFEPRPSLVACDLSVPMLLTAGVRGVAADVTLLPFAANAFDAVTFGFVLSHVPDPVTVLVELKRVLSANGRVALSAWSSSAGSTAPGEVWLRVSEEYVTPAEIDRAVSTVVPSEDVLATIDGLRATLSDAGFAAIRVIQREYSVNLRTEDFVRTRMLAAHSRYMRARLTTGQWNDLLAKVSSQLHDRFGSQVSFQIAANFAIASVTSL